MNESTVIMIFVAANPSKDIPRARKKLSEKGTNWRLSIAPFPPSSGIKPRHLLVSGSLGVAEFRYDSLAIAISETR